MEAQYIKNVKIVNDLGCSWINDLDRRSNIKNLDKDKSCDWLIVGAGYTGLSAARKLSRRSSIFLLNQEFGPLLRAHFLWNSFCFSLSLYGIVLLWVHLYL